MSGALLLLLVVFQWNGGVAAFAASMAKLSLSSRRFQEADSWLKFARWFSSSGSIDFLQAKSNRLQGDLDTMAIHLKNAHAKGYDPRLLDQEQTLALASIGRLDSATEEQLNRWLNDATMDTHEVMDAYSKGLTTVSRFEHAAELLQLWSQDAPNDFTPNYRMARIHEHLLQFQEAEEQYRIAIRKAPTFEKAQFNLARLLLDQKKPDEALKLYQFCEKGEGKLAAFTGMAGCYKTLGETEKAVKLLQEVLRAPYEEQIKSFRAMDYLPERFVAASELGCIEAEAGDFQQAKEHLQNALEIFPLDSIGRYSYAVTLRGLGLQEEAEKNFQIVQSARAALDRVSLLQESLRKDPKDTSARIAIGKIVLEHESEQTGVFWIQSVFAYDPSNIDAHRALAEFYDSKKNPSDEDKKLVKFHKSFLAQSSTVAKP